MDWIQIKFDMYRELEGDTMYMRLLEKSAPQHHLAMGDLVTYSPRLGATDTGQD